MKVAVAAGFAVMAAAAHSSAQGAASGQDVATAQALFDEGKRLMTANNFVEACPKLVESQRIDPGGGTLLAIALCHEGEGKTATAWADFNVALAEARRDRRPDREAAAAEHIKSLEPKLTRARVVVLAKVSGLEVTRDGTRLGEAQWGTPLPTDPGEHAFEAKAPGKVAWHGTSDVRGEGKIVDVVIPSLADEPQPLVKTSPVEQPVQAEPSSQKTWALAVGGVGLVALGVGAGFGISASSKWSDAEQACPGNRCRDPKDRDLGSDAGRAADISTVLFAVGAVGVGAGVVLWLTAPKERRSALRFVPTASATSVGFSFGGAL